MTPSAVRQFEVSRPSPANDRATGAKSRQLQMVRTEGIEPSQELPPYGFSYHFGFRRRYQRSWSGLSLHLGKML